MSTLQRYDNPDVMGNMNEDSTGDWVKYNDVLILLAKIAEEAKKITQECEELAILVRDKDALEEKLAKAEYLNSEYFIAIAPLIGADARQAYDFTDHKIILEQLETWKLKQKKPKADMRKNIDPIDSQFNARFDLEEYCQELEAKLSDLEQDIENQSNADSFVFSNMAECATEQKRQNEELKNKLNKAIKLIDTLHIAHSDDTAVKNFIKEYSEIVKPCEQIMIIDDTNNSECLPIYSQEQLDLMEKKLEDDDEEIAWQLTKKFIRFPTQVQRRIFKTIGLLEEGETSTSESHEQFLVTLFQRANDKGKVLELFIEIEKQTNVNSEG